MRAKGGPQRTTEGKSRNLNGKRQHQPKKPYWPKPHYHGLRRQVRNMIRPFRWIPLPDGTDANETILPPEVRNMIYSFAIRPDCSATGYVGRDRILLRCDHNFDAIYEELKLWSPRLGYWPCTPHHAPIQNHRHTHSCQQQETRAVQSLKIHHIRDTQP